MQLTSFTTGLGQIIIRKLSNIQHPLHAYIVHYIPNINNSNRSIKNKEPNLLLLEN